jgi:DNA-binding NtrC family response regulator
MQSSAQFHAQPSASGLALVELDSATASMHVVGVSAAWRKLLMQAEMAAPHLQVAAIEGEYGSGKHTLARYLFDRSPLAASSFQRRDAREWLATDADPSTLAGFTYLDRVDLLAPQGQSLLLGVLKGLQDRPPGHAVILASSQIPLRHMAGQGMLLPDLAFRLTAIRFAVTPLRQRREDIAPLVHFLLDRICARYKQRPVILGPGTLARLLQHAWPGNVRELSGILENALLRADNGVIRASDLAMPDVLQPLFDLPFSVNSAANPLGIPVINPLANPLVNPMLNPAFNPNLHPQFNPLLNKWSSPSAGGAPMLDPQTARLADLSLDAVIRQHVHFVLDLNRGNKLRTARQLAISRSTLYRILANESLLAR